MCTLTLHMFLKYAHSHSIHKVGSVSSMLALHEAHFTAAVTADTVVLHMHWSFDGVCA